MQSFNHTHTHKVSYKQMNSYNLMSIGRCIIAITEEYKNN